MPTVKFLFIGFLMSLSAWWQALPDNLSFLRERVAANWQEFLGYAEPIKPAASLESPEAPITLTASSTAADIQKLIDQQVRTGLNSFLDQVKKPGGVVYSSGGSPGGLIVVPSTGNTASDEAIRAKIQNAFSDRVTVQYDPSGTTGVITPVFTSGRGNDYLFLLAPVRR